MFFMFLEGNLPLNHNFKFFYFAFYLVLSCKFLKDSSMQILKGIVYHPTYLILFNFYDL